MSDLTEALESYDGLVGHFPAMGLETTPQLKSVMDAARAYAAGRDIQRCSVHDADWIPYEPFCDSYHIAPDKSCELMVMRLSPTVETL